MAHPSRSRPRGTHEDLSRDGDVKPGSERAFGLTMATVLGLVGMMPLFNDEAIYAFAIPPALLLMAAALMVPETLRLPNLWWFRFGMLLHRIVSPLVMGLLFLTTVVPIGLLMRLSGADPLRRRFDPTADSYWIARTPPGPTPESMKKQF